MSEKVKRNRCEGTMGVPEDHELYGKPHLFPESCKRKYFKRGVNDPKVYYQCLICLYKEGKYEALKSIQNAKKGLNGELSSRRLIGGKSKFEKDLADGERQLAHCESELKKLDDEGYGK